MELIYVEAYKSKKDFFQREKMFKYYRGALKNLRLRLNDTFLTGGMG